MPYAIIAEATRGKYEVHSPAGQVVTARGEAWVAPPNVPLRITHHPDARSGRGTCYRFIHCSFTVHGSLDVCHLLRLPLKLDGAAYREVGPVIEEFLARDTPGMAKNLRWLVRRQELAFRVLRIIVEQSQPSPQASLRLVASLRLKPLLQYLAEHLASPITAEEMARRCHMSLSGFHRQFQQWIGTSPMNHLKHLRLNEAARLLLTTDLTLGEISERTGFANPFHFSREFKKQYRESPRRYRVHLPG